MTSEFSSTNNTNLPVRLFLLRVLRMLCHIEIISLDLILGVSSGNFVLKHIACQICVSAN